MKGFKQTLRESTVIIEGNAIEREEPNVIIWDKKRKFFFSFIYYHFSRVTITEFNFFILKAEKPMYREVYSVNKGLI